MGTSIDLNVTERGIKNWKASIGFRNLGKHRCSKLQCPGESPSHTEVKGSQIGNENMEVEDGTTLS